MKTPFLCFSLFASSLFSTAQADLSPTLIESGKETASYDFADSDQLESFSAAKGAWTVEDGALKGVELAADKHAAVLGLMQPHTDSAISFRFQLAGSAGFSLSYNHAKGHLFRVSVSENKVVVVMDKDKKDPTSKRELVAETEAEIEPGEWYDLLCETVGDKVVVQLGKRIKLEGAYAGITREKTGYRFVLKGEGVLFDDVKAWQPN